MMPAISQRQVRGVVNQLIPIKLGHETSGFRIARGRKESGRRQRRPVAGGKRKGVVAPTGLQLGSISPVSSIGPACDWTAGRSAAWRCLGRWMLRSREQTPLQALGCTILSEQRISAERKPAQHQSGHHNRLDHLTSRFTDENNGQYRLTLRCASTQIPERSIRRREPGEKQSRSQYFVEQAVNQGKCLFRFDRSRCNSDC
jgi:hypothetical protein